MISFDSLLLLLFAVINITHKEWLGWAKIGVQGPVDLVSLYLITAAIVFLLLDFAFEFLPRFQVAYGRIFFKLKMLVFGFIIILMVGMPLLSNIMIRHTSVNYLFIHDGALQTEIASRFLFKGKNPYAADYFGTPLEFWQYSEPGYKEVKNPALYHYVYLPSFLITSALGQIVQKIILGWEDLRFTLFAEYLGMLAIVWLLVRNIKEKFLYMVLFAVNPLVVHFLLEGRNDTASFFFLIACAFFLQRKNLVLSAVFLAVSVTFKQTLWLALPFLLCYVYSAKDTKQKAFLYTVIFFIVSAGITLPFFLWNPSSFVNSTLGYMNGTVSHSYPINSIGFAKLLLSLHVIKDSHSYFPFWIFQVLSVGPLIFVFLRSLRQNPKISTIFLFFGITMLVFLYFSRVFSDSYITLIFLVLGTAFIFYKREELKGQ